MRNWRLYCRFKGQKDFKAVDWSTGKQTSRLIYASLFSDEEKSKIERIDFAANPDIEFEFRKLANGDYL